MGKYMNRNTAMKEGSLAEVLELQELRKSVDALVREQRETNRLLLSLVTPPQHIPAAPPV